MSQASSARSAALRAARARDSETKRRRAVEVVASLEQAGTAVTFAAVAKAAAVSSWLVYAPGVREHVEAAQRRQAEGDCLPASATPSIAGRATSAGLRADLAMAREEIRRLRADQDVLRKRLRLQLGAEIEGPERAELIGRVADLEALNRRLVAERDARVAEANVAVRRARELDDELTAARESLRRVIRDTNR